MRHATETIHTSTITRGESYLLFEANRATDHQVKAAILEAPGVRQGVRRYRALENLIKKGLMTETRRYAGSVVLGDGRTVGNLTELSAVKIESGREIENSDRN